MTVRILEGDNRDLLAAMAAAGEQVNCCVTSPPYWGLRDYGTAPLDWPAVEYSPLPGLAPITVPAMQCQLGLEATLDAFIGHIVHTFRALRPVLRDDGVLWVNMGDCYVTRPYGDSHSFDPKYGGRNREAGYPHRQPIAGLKSKDLAGQPWRVAFALQADGWYLRQDVIWAKPNPMPESTRDRCTKSHEYLFLLAKSERYAWDFEAMQEPVNGGAHARRGGETGVGFGRGYDAVQKPRYRSNDRTPAGWANGTDRAHTELGGNYTAARQQASNVGRREGPPGNPAERKLAENRDAKNNGSMDTALNAMPSTRNRRSVWTIATEAFKEAHFATFPTDLVEPCIRAGCPAGGTVLDIFGGAGTTALVADRLQRNAISMEIKPDYADMQRRRIHGDAGMFAEVTAA